jgi:glycosyltransferase involved in cell wall biosynthesis
MKISGFSYARNADSLYYPIKESILSILPVCDEFIIAIGKSTDRTREIVASIGDPKIKIIDTIWEDKEKIGDHVFRQQANIALAACTGDWCFHLQCDEVIHENDLSLIQNRCQELLDDKEVEGLLLNFRHFWGDYRHHIINHHWFTREIRIVRNGLGIESYKDSQSFRRNNEKLKVAAIPATVFHYGWVRPPSVMQAKRVAFTAAGQGVQKAKERHQQDSPVFDYGSLAKIPTYDGSHPRVMTDWIARMDWQNQLQYKGKSPVRHHHDKFKYRFLTFIEQHFLGGKQIGGFKNYELIEDEPAMRKRSAPTSDDDLF